MGHFVGSDPIPLVANPGDDRDRHPGNGGADGVAVPPAQVGGAATASDDANGVEFQFLLLQCQDFQCPAN